MSRSGRGSNQGLSKGLKNNTCRSYLIDLLKALYYCHNVAKITHRDIKPDNIMINHNEEAVLINFGVANLLKDKYEDP
jgi:serine/threonine protein kinase